MLGDDLDGIHVELVPESLVRFDAEELLHGLPHHLLIQAACDILVGVGVAHEHEVDALARRGLLERDHLAVLGVIGGGIVPATLQRAELVFQQGNQATRGDVSEPVPGRIADVLSAGGHDVPILVNHDGGRRLIGPDAIFDTDEVVDVEIIPLVVSPLQDDIFQGPSFIRLRLRGVEGGNDFQTVLVILFIHPFQDRHEFLGERTPGGPVQQYGNLVLGNDLLVGNRLAGDQVLQVMVRPESGDIIVSDLHERGGVRRFRHGEIHVDQIRGILGRDERVGNPGVQAQFAPQPQLGTQTRPGIGNRSGKVVVSDAQAL